MQEPQMAPVCIGFVVTVKQGLYTLAKLAIPSKDVSDSFARLLSMQHKASTQQKAKLVAHRTWLADACGSISVRV